MTSEQKIITIAEFEGWKNGTWSGDCHRGSGWLAPGETQESAFLKGNCIAWRSSELPPYLTSRDAICGAVARLNNMEFCYFVEHLERVCKTDGWEIMGSNDRRRMLLATPTQLADALLLTLGYEI
jgi:hypothetical protein